MKKPKLKKQTKTKPHEPEDAVIALLERLPRIRAMDEGPYTYTDRARDFVTVFSTDSGKRVLSQIHQICDPSSRPTDADRHGTLAYKAGMLRVMGEIMLCMIAREPLKIETEPTDGGTNG